MANEKGQGPAAPRPDQHPPRNREPRWLIWSRDHKGFWRAERAAPPTEVRRYQQLYTSDLDSAGRFTHLEAKRIVEDAQRGGLPADATEQQRRNWPPEAMVLAPECAPCAAIIDVLPELEQMALVAFLNSTVTGEQGGLNSHGTLDAAKLIRMLLEDVAWMIHRPGSWEGANMGQVMSSHGYDQWRSDPLCQAVHVRYWRGKSPYAPDGSGRLKR